MCSKRRVKIKVKKQNYADVKANLGLLKVDGEYVEEIVELEDSKKTYEFLVKSDLIEDWEMEEVPPQAHYRSGVYNPNNILGPGHRGIIDPDDNVVLCNNTSSTEFVHSSEKPFKSSEEELSELEEILIDKIPDSATQEQVCEYLVWLMLAVLHCRKQKPALRFTARIFKEEVVDKIDDTRGFDTNEYKMIKGFLGGYYGFDELSLGDILRDFTEHCQEVWFKIKDDTILTLTEKMYDVKISMSGDKVVFS